MTETDHSTDPAGPLDHWYRLVDINAHVIVEALNSGQMVHLRPLTHYGANGKPYNSIRVTIGW